MTGLTVALATASASAARAEALLGRGLVLDQGELEAALSIEKNISYRDHRDTWSIAPDASYGITDDLTVGVGHSARFLALVDSGFGVCLGRGEHGCDRTYDDVAVDAKWSLLRGAVSAAGHVRLVSRSFDPWKPSLRFGALMRATWRRLGVIADPQLQLGLYNTDRGNRTWLRVPVWLAVEPWRGVMLLALRTGVHGEWKTFRQTYDVPVALDATVHVGRGMDVSLLVGFASIIGPQNNGRNRDVNLTLTYHWP